MLVTNLAGREELPPRTETKQLQILTLSSQACKADLHDSVCGKMKGTGKAALLLFARYGFTTQISCSKIKKAFLQITYLYLLQERTASQSLQKPEKEREKEGE